MTRVCISLLPRLKFIDVPDPRKIHQKIIPRGGGIAVFIAFFAASYVYSLVHPGDATVFLAKLILPAMIIFVTGLLDDRFGLRAITKLFIQLGCGALIWLNGSTISTFFGWELHPMISLIVTVLWVASLINAFNLIDGLDGLSSGLAIVASSSLAIWALFNNSLSGAVLMLILAGACLGFLRYNFNPARIFIGDTGSMFLGLMFAYTGLDQMDTSVTLTSVLVPLLAVGVPVFDTCLAFWRRFMRRLYDPATTGIMTPDREHLHHRFLDKYHDQKKTAVYLYLFACLLAGGALVISSIGNTVPTLAYAILLIAVFVVVRRFAVVELYHSAQAVLVGLRRPKRNFLLSALHPLFDLLMVGTAYWITCFFFRGIWSNVYLAVGCVGSVFLVLLFSGTYRIYWLRSGTSDYWLLLQRLCLGALIALCCYSYMLLQVPPRELRIEFGPFVFWLMLFVLLIMGERLFLRYVESFMLRSLYLKRNEATLKQTVVYGGGLNCRLYLNSLNHRYNQKPVKIIGIIDDDSVLYQLRIYGLPVFGGFEHIEEIYTKHPFERVVITSGSMDETKINAMRDFCLSHGVEVFLFEPREEFLGAGVRGQNPAKN